MDEGSCISHVANESMRAQNSIPLLREVAYTRIKEAIITGIFQPREFLSESKLTAFLEMSKTPIKSAIDRLETEGFVSVAPKQGIIVTELSVEKVRDIFDLRIALESYVCERISGRLNARQQELIEENLQNSVIAADGEDETNFAKIDSQFHLLLCDFCDNKELYHTMANYQDHLYLNALSVLRKDPGRMRNSHKDHVLVYQALLSQEPSEAIRIMREHLMYGQSILVR